MRSKRGCRITAKADRIPPRSVIVAGTPGDQRLSDGVVIEASIVARLLGMRILRLKAYVTLLPASRESVTMADGYTDAGPWTTAQPAPDQLDAGGTLSAATTLLAHAHRTIHETAGLHP
jgi:hypothetical protein